jgi:hypothetical protein
MLSKVNDPHAKPPSGVDALVMDLWISHTFPRVLYGDAANAPMLIKLEQRILIQILRLDGRVRPEGDVKRIGLLKILHSHISRLLIASVEKRIVNGLAILEEDNAQNTIFHFRNPNPPPNPAITLNRLSDWRLDRTENPLIRNESPVCSLFNLLEISSRLHHQAAEAQRIPS